MGIFNENSMQAIAEYINTSDKNAKESDETWADGFKIVQEKLDKLHQFFTPQEIEAIIINKDEIREVLQAAS